MESVIAICVLRRNEVSRDFAELLQDERKSILFSTQITSDLERIADYITYIHNGQVVFSSTKDEVSEIIEFLRNPQRFRRLGGRIPRGVLLVGEPGCGKTLLAQTLARFLNVPFTTTSTARKPCLPRWRKTCAIFFSICLIIRTIRTNR